MNNQTQEALKMAIVAMDTWKDIDVLKARKMCKEALAQPAQEPVAYIHRNEWNEYRLEPMDDFNITTIPWNVDILLYTHPAPSWQGLSDYDILSIDGLDCVNENDLISFAHAVVAKLKEKNK